MAVPDPVQATTNRPSIAQLRKKCERRGLSVAGCVERSDLERLLAEGVPSGSVYPGAQVRFTANTPPRSARESLSEIAEELNSWVGYGPRALALLRQLSNVRCDAAFRENAIGHIVRKYTTHPDQAVAKLANEHISRLKDALEGLQSGRRPRPLKPPAVKPNGTKRAVDDDETGSSSSSSSSSCCEEVDVIVDDTTAPTPAAAAGTAIPSSPQIGWVQTTKVQRHRGKEERFFGFTLRQPFKCDSFLITIRIAQDARQEECKDLLTQMASDFGAMEPSTDALSTTDQPVLERLQRLEDRFRGSGVTESEARNAMRLFERELSKANWTEEKFEKLKKQLAGVEGWSAADAVAEGCLLWAEPCKRRLAWFSDACERVAMPLGIEFGYASNGGCCFAGPLSSVAGAALTSALLCHFARLDLERAKKCRGGSKTSGPQFMQGFVDGALAQERHLVWSKLYAIENDGEAAEYCQTALERGFFDEGGCHKEASFAKKPVATKKTGGINNDQRSSKTATKNVAGDTGNDQRSSKIAGKNETVGIKNDQTSSKPAAQNEAGGIENDQQSSKPAQNETGGSMDDQRLDPNDDVESVDVPDAGVPHSHDPDSDLQSMLQGLFSGFSRRQGAPNPNAGNTARAGAGAPQSFTPFSGKAMKLGDDDDDDPKLSGKGESSKFPEPTKTGCKIDESGLDQNHQQPESSWALVFTSNVQLARASRRRSRDEARKTYHWTFSARAVKATKKGTTSYTQGKQAGEKRKGDIDGTARSAKNKYCKSRRLAITQ